jgi:PKD repeat protein
MKPFRTLVGSLVLSLIALLPGCYKKGQPQPVYIAVTDSIVGNPATVPVGVLFANNSSGADSFQWSFPGGNPTTSSLRDPGTVMYSQAGDYTVTLLAWNKDEQKSQQFSFHFDSSVQVAFDTAVIGNRFAPMTEQVTNKTVGGSTYSWTFQGGIPASSTLAKPPNIVFDSAGPHVITLQVSNGGQTFSLSKTITVLPSLAAAFTLTPSFDNDDYQAPVNATLKNTSVSTLFSRWRCAGATIGDTTAASTSIYFPSPGSYTVTLVTGNGKSTQTISQTYTILPNTNLRTLTGIQLGINTAQQSIGVFYSTYLRRVFTSTQRPDTAGKWIDLVFYGLDDSFVFNKFISPDSVTDYAFAPITNPGATVVINSQETCGCSAAMSVSAFGAMTDDGPLQALTIQATPGGSEPFTNSLVPRVVLFQSPDGRKGAIRIDQWVQNGQGSYIVCDIKVQKAPL